MGSPRLVERRSPIRALLSRGGIDLPRTVLLGPLMAVPSFTLRLFSSLEKSRYFSVEMPVCADRVEYQGLRSGLLGLKNRNEARCG
jgi:hypothetical protein